MSTINTAATTARAYSPSWRLVSVIVLRSLVHLLIRNKWGGRENVPGSGGVILAVNHLSHFLLTLLLFARVEDPCGRLAEPGGNRRFGFGRGKRTFKPAGIGCNPEEGP